MASAVAAAAGDLTQSKTIDKAMLALGLKETLRAGHSLDVALFGRMVADLADLNVDAASQVAHAISTHAAKTQFDYFTAVDDEQEEAETGAGMIGTVEFNSATMYRFATVAVPQLAANLGDHAAAFDGVARFIRAFALSMPTGHQTSFAARTRPALVLVVVRQDQPVNLVSAFERPVWPGQQGVMAGSQEALADFYQTEVQRWGDQPALVVASYNAVDDKGHEKLVAAFGPSRPLDEVIEAVGGVLRGLGRDHD
jgi:CRISPR system Cascade subunit CasC